MKWDMFESSPALEKIKENRKKMLADILRSKAECEVGHVNAPSVQPYIKDMREHACVYLFESTSMTNRFLNMFRKNKRCEYVVVFVSVYNITGFVRSFLQEYTHKKPLSEYDAEKLVLALVLFSAQYEIMRYLPSMPDLNSPRLTLKNVLREYEKVGDTVKIDAAELALARLEGYTYYQRLWDNV
tara:strand:- start:124 stop:678 length:555 start_codon:yes stop_codon:yes gene_type:complete